MKKIYFPNLNGLRFIAALLVIIHHIEQIKSLLNIQNIWNSSPFVGVIGKLGVVLFFVLSGFLITYLLLAEEKSLKTINVRNFYFRRMLRIWPLYFLIVALAFFVLPNIPLFTLPGFGKEVVYNNLFLKLFLYVIFFPNLVTTLAGIVPYVSHAWSIGPEEQFYLVWPFILRRIRKYRIYLMLFIIFFYLLIKTLILEFSHQIIGGTLLKAFWLGFNIDCMAIGGLFAVLLFQKHRLLNFFINKYLFYFSCIFIIVMLANGVEIPHIHYEFYALFFGIIILNFAANDQIKISFENRVFNYLGNISYGLYMYHPIAITLAIVTVKHFGSSLWMIYPLTVLLTILIAGLSYKYYETYFLKFKNKFTDIASGSKV
ncbi:acyltransferase family protein [Flavobacterium noncentrifugens]|uniref:Peptidoglycan/LPS O-acetylase OafA/YrhL, contains acyltransferase and SGNH-hydrolase domains n=1 Tax=Flavobacterium noncentrifugens TaxID=1128970 RepID=A0A1G8XS98_9FLAO|nr:acyltransferase [Flavobacterium noncentrifugens]SDJ93542.1 Peptidoglycan/LPS O-acetylase OafA/YrhL, contains acyltransferase and SGNH-hydrolase domains [Flavobacterium noncentrifugens]